MDKEVRTQRTQDQIPESLSSIEIDAIGEILNISMGSAATAVSTLLGRKVSITTPAVTVTDSSELQLKNLEPAIGIEIEYTEGLSGNNLLVMKRSDIKSIVSLLLAGMEDTGADEESLNEMELSAVSEIMNQMMGASSTALASFLGKNINISTPKQFDINKKFSELGLGYEQPYLVSVKFTLEVEEVLHSEFLTLLPLDFTKELVKNALNFDDAEESTLAEVKEVPAKEQPVKNAAPPATETPKNPPIKANLQVAKQSPVSVQPVRLPSFSDSSTEKVSGEAEQDNFNLILGVPLEVTVEIGRTAMTVKNILQIRQGSIVELDRQAGDPVDVIVNGQMIAKGDVVIIDDNFGVRITEILSKSDLSSAIN